MFVVKRAFKNKGKALTAGTIISNPADIKHFKSRVSDGKIIEVTEQNYESYRQYFKHKFGVDIKPTEKLDKEVTKEPVKVDIKPTEKLDKKVAKEPVKVTVKNSTV